MLVIHLNGAIDKYSPTLHYVEGPHNVVAETFSRLLRQDDTSALVGKKPTSMTMNWLGTLCLMIRRYLTVS
jgi:hypothetical protein